MPYLHIQSVESTLVRLTFKYSGYFYGHTYIEVKVQNVRTPGTTGMMCRHESKSRLMSNILQTISYIKIEFPKILFLQQNCELLEQSTIACSGRPSHVNILNQTGQMFYYTQGIFTQTHSLTHSY